MSPEKYAVEAQTAASLGYTSIKIKARPWFDVYETVRRISAVTPDWFCIDADWNDFLINVSNAVPVLRELEQDFPKIKIFEGPMRGDDVPGNKLLRSLWQCAAAHRDWRGLLRWLCHRRRRGTGNGRWPGLGHGQHALLFADGRHGVDHHLDAAPGRSA
jgi:hypothetical protein